MLRLPATELKPRRVNRTSTLEPAASARLLHGVDVPAMSTYVAEVEAVIPVGDSADMTAMLVMRVIASRTCAASAAVGGWLTSQLVGKAAGICEPSSLQGQRRGAPELHRRAGG